MKIRERILTEETIVELVTLVLRRLMLRPVSLPVGWRSSMPSLVTLEVLSPCIFSPRHREEQLEAAREDAATQLEQRRVEPPTTEEIKRYVADFREFL